MPDSAEPGIFDERRDADNGDQRMRERCIFQPTDDYPAAARSNESSEVFSSISGWFYVH